MLGHSHADCDYKRFVTIEQLSSKSAMLLSAAGKNNIIFRSDSNAEDLAG